MHKKIGLLTFCFLSLASSAVCAFQNTPLGERAQQLLHKSQQLLKAGQTTQAQILLKEARVLQVALADHYKKQGRQYAQKSQWNKAQKAFEQALENHYADPITHQELGRVFLRKKQYQKALSALTKSLEIDPNIETTHIFLEQAVRDNYQRGLARSFKHYAFPCQAIAFQEQDSLRIEIAYALPKVGLTRAGGIGVVHIDQEIDFISPTNTLSHLVQSDHLPECGNTTLEKNYLLAEHTLRIPSNTSTLHLTIKDRNIGSVGSYKAPITPTTDAFTLSLSTPLLAQSIYARTEYPQKRDDLKISPNPLRLYKAQTPVFVYLEIYNLLPTAWGNTDFELSYQIQWPEENEINPQLFEALDTEFLGDLPESLSALQYLIPNKHRQNMTISQTPATESSTQVTIPYIGRQTNDMTYLEIDTSHLPPGIHKLILTAKDLVAEESVTQTALFRIIP